jgi:hypothetical protein
LPWPPCCGEMIVKVAANWTHCFSTKTAWTHHPITLNTWKMKYKRCSLGGGGWLYWKSPNAHFPTFLYSSGLILLHKYSDYNWNVSKMHEIAFRRP